MIYICSVSYQCSKNREKQTTLRGDTNVTKIYRIYLYELRKKYIQTKDKRYWRALIQLLPESYNQTRTWTANYAVLRNIYFARRNHKLTEWREFCQWIETLPWAKELICLEEKKEHETL